MKKKKNICSSQPAKFYTEGALPKHILTKIMLQYTRDAEHPDWNFQQGVLWLIGFFFIHYCGSSSSTIMVFLHLWSFSRVTLPYDDIFHFNHHFSIQKKVLFWIWPLFYENDFFFGSTYRLFAQNTNFFLKIPTFFENTNFFFENTNFFFENANFYLKIPKYQL